VEGERSLSTRETRRGWRGSKWSWGYEGWVVMGGGGEERVGSGWRLGDLDSGWDDG